MRMQRRRQSEAGACNDNGVILLAARGNPPRDALTVARRIGGPIALSYLASGCMLITAPSRPRGSAAA